MHDHSREPASDETDAWTVPAPLLAHALRTPLNILGGYAALLAHGELGALPPEAREAALAVREAAAALERTVELLPAPPPAPRPGPLTLPLGQVVARAARAQGWEVRETDGFALDGIAWSGWAGLWATLIAGASPPIARTLRLAGEGPRLVIGVDPAAFGGGGEQLPEHLATRRAAAAGMALARAATGTWHLDGAGLMRGCGTLIFHRANAACGGSQSR